MKRLLYLFAAGILMGTVSCKKTPTNNNCIKGPAGTNCFCPLFYNPVCGCDKVTYGNSCEAECAGITTYTAGKCP